MTESHEKYFKYRITNVILISNFFRVGKNVTVKNNQGSREEYGCYLGKRPTSAASTGRGTSFQRGDGSLGKTFARQGQSRIFIKRPCVWYITHDNPAGGRGVWNRKPKPWGRGSARVLHTRAPKLARPSFNSNFYLYESCIIVSPLERRRLPAPCSIPFPSLPRSSLYYNQSFSRERGISNSIFLLKYWNVF